MRSYLGKIVIVCIMFVIYGVSCNAQTLNQVVMADFQQSLPTARVYQGSVMNGLNEKIDVKLTVYAEPVVIDEVLESMEEADVSTPEGVLLSDLSCTSVEWLGFNRNEEIDPQLWEFHVTGMAGRSIFLSEPIRFHVVARWDFNYNDVDYVIYKVFEQRPGNERIEHYMATTSLIGKSDDRWSLMPRFEGVFPIVSLTTNLRIVVIEEMLSGRFYSPTHEIQDLYLKSYSDGLLNMDYFDQGMRELYKQKFDLSEIFSTYVYEEFERYPELDFFEVQAEFYEKGSEESADIAAKAQEAARRAKED